MKITSFEQLKSCLDKKESIDEIDLTNFSVDQFHEFGRNEIKKIISEYYKRSVLLKLVGFPKGITSKDISLISSDTSKGKLFMALLISSIWLGRVNWQLSDEQRKSYREFLLKNKASVFGSLEDGFLIDEDRMIRNVNAGIFDFKAKIPPEQTFFSTANIIGTTKPMWLAYFGMIRTLKLILERDPTVLKDQDNDGNTVAMFAAYTGYAESFQLIYEEILCNSLDFDSTGFNKALKIALCQEQLGGSSFGEKTELSDSFKEIEVTSVEELKDWLDSHLTENTIKRLKENQVKDTIKHFSSIVSEKREKEGEFSLIDLKEVGGSLLPNVSQSIVEKWLENLYPEKALLTESEIGTVMEFLSKRERFKDETSRQASLDSLLKVLGLREGVAVREELSEKEEIGKEEEEEEGSELKRHRKM